MALPLWELVLCMLETNHRGSMLVGANVVVYRSFSLEMRRYPANLMTEDDGVSLSVVRREPYRSSMRVVHRMWVNGSETAR